LTVDAIILDLFGVVIAFDDGLVYARIAKHCARPDRALSQLQGLVSLPELITGVLTLHDLHERLVRDHGLALELTAFEELWREPYSQPMPGMALLLEQLAAHRPLLLLSNVDRYYWQTVVTRHPELGHFGHLLTSWELGMAKPERRCFLRAADVAGCVPSSCLFIDDKHENLAAAHELGFQTHHFRDVRGLRRRLLDAGVPGTSRT
jgi:HAD superfamily hydrolase (TIGR01509 family)